MNHLCGCYYHVASTEYYTRIQKHYLPLLDSTIHSTILSTTSRTVLKQKFTNPSSTDAIKKCIYAFPLYDGVSVVSFTCRIGRKVLRGLVKEKVKAKQIFDDAVAKGETAGLLEQAPEASDVFCTKLGNISAGQSVIVEITYIGELKHHEADGIRFTIPTKIAPRYGSGPAYESILQAQDGAGIKITVDVNMPEGSFIKAVQSPSHPIAVSMGTVSTASTADPLMSKASATLSVGSIALEKDFVLIVQSKDIGMPKAILEIHPTIRNHRALMATLVPKFSLPSSRPEIVFVADRSGSMSQNMKMLISAMQVFLKSMPVGVKFNICSFGSTCSFLWGKSQSYTQETLQQASDHLLSFRSDMGRTETFGAIQATIERRYTDIPLEIILLTDGDIWRQEDLLKYVNEQVEQANGNIRVFPLGIGSGVSHALIEGLARAGNGFAQAVQLGERLENCVVRMLRGALSPHITDYTLEVKYEKENDDFELIDKVTDGMKILLSDDDKAAEAKEEKPTISLFDTNANPDKDQLKGLKDSQFWLPEVPHPKLHQAPHKIPTLFSFSRTSVYLLMSPETIQRNPTAIVLRATSAYGPLALEIPIEALSTPAETIHQLAAKKAVQDLEEGRGWIYDAKDQNGVLVKDRYPSCFDDLVQREAVRLGEKYQIAGKWCSFVAVAANDKEIAEKEKKVIEQKSLVVDDDGEIYAELDMEVQEDLGLYGSDDEEGFMMISGSPAPAPPYQAVDMSVHNHPRSRRVKYRKAIGIGGSIPQTSQSISVSTGSQSPPSYGTGSIFGQLANPSILQPQVAVPASCSPPALSVQPQLHAQQSYPFFGSPSHVSSSPKLSNEKVLLNAGFGAPQKTGVPSGNSPFQDVSGGGPGFGNQPPVYGTVTAHACRSPSGISGLLGSFYSQPSNAPLSIGNGPNNLFGGIQPSTQGTPGFARVSSAYSPLSDTSRIFSPASYSAEATSNPAAQQAQIAQQQILQPQTQPNGRRSSRFSASVAPPPAPPATPAQSKTYFKRSKVAQGIHFQSPAPEAVSSSPTSSPQARKAVPNRKEWVSQSTAEKVLAIISLQTYEGYWPGDDDEISRIIGLGNVGGKVGVERKVWITILVVRWLEIRCSEEEGTWALVAEKARGWLEGLVGMELEVLEREAGELVEKIGVEGLGDENDD